MSCTAASDLLPIHTIFKGKTKRPLPTGPAVSLLRLVGWHITCTSTHWSTLQTMKDYVEFIYLPFVKGKCTNLGLDPQSPKSILLLDAFTVHKSDAFRTWMSETHPEICLLFVPARCTTKLQPCDVVIQRPFKCAVHHFFMNFCVNKIRRQMAGGVSAKSTRLHTHIGVLRNKLCDWLLQAHAQVAEKRDMIVKGWKNIGGLQAWDEAFQAAAMGANAQGLLFNNPQISNDIDDNLFNDDFQWYGDVEVDDLMVAPDHGEMIRAMVASDSSDSEDDGNLESEIMGRPIASYFVNVDNDSA